MSTNTKPLQGRHRATVDTRPALPRATVRLLVGGVVAVLLCAVVGWQVV